MKNYNELSYEEQKELRDLLACEMTEEQKIQFCQYMTETYQLDDYQDNADLFSRLAEFFLCAPALNDSTTSEERLLLYTATDMCRALAHLFTRMYRM